MALVPSSYEERTAQLAASTVVGAVGWDEHLHPRARDGRFIKKGGWVRGLFRLNGSVEKHSGRVTAVHPNSKDRRDPIISVDVQGEIMHTRASRIESAADYKAALDPGLGAKGTWNGKPEKPYVSPTIGPSKQVFPKPKGHGSLFDFKPKPFVPPKPLKERIADAIAAVNKAAEKLSTTDPVERAKGLDKIMGGVRGSVLSTVVQKNKRGKSYDEWELLHLAKQEKLWGEFLARIEAAGIPKERKALVMGGLPGAGKSWSLQPGMVAGKLGVVGWDSLGEPPPGATHVIVNPDIVKEMMVNAGMLPEGVSPLIKPMEQASFIHAESNFLVALFFQRLSYLGYNVVYDTTMANVPHMTKNLSPLAEMGYSFQGIYLDISRQESRASAENRYAKEWQSPLGGRFVPTEAIGSNDTSGVFDQMIDWFDEGWMYVDNTGISTGNPAWDIVEEGIGTGRPLEKYRIIRAAADDAYTGSRLAREIHLGELDLGQALVLLGRNEVYVDDEVGDEWDDALAKSTLFHEVIARGGEWGPFDEEVARLRAEGLTMAAVIDDAMTAAATFWDPSLHPRGRDGRFIEVGGWVLGMLTLQGGKRKKLRGQVTGFAPNTKDPDNPVIQVETSDGPAIALTSDIAEATPPKAQLEEDAFHVEVTKLRGQLLEVLGGRVIGEMGLKELSKGKKPTPLLKQVEALSTQMGAIVDGEILKRVTESGTKLLTQEEFIQRGKYLHGLKQMLVAKAANIREALEDPNLTGVEKTKSGALAALNDPAWKANMAEQQKVADALVALDQNRHIYRTTYAMTAREVLAEVVEGGIGAPIATTWYKTPVEEAKALALLIDNQGPGAVYPTSWIEASNLAGTVSIHAKEGRAYYMPGLAQMQLDPVSSKKAEQTTIHEFGHRMEDTVAGLRMLEYAFYWRRVGDEPLQSLAVLLGDKHYGNEQTRPDKFPTPYMGKPYGGGPEHSWELFTVAAEDLLSSHVIKGTYGVNGLMHDEDFRAWFLGTLVSIVPPKAKLDPKPPGDLVNAMPTSTDTQKGEAWDLRPGDVAYVPAAGGTWRVEVDHAILTTPDSVLIYGERERLGDLPQASGVEHSLFLNVNPSTPVLIERDSKVELPDKPVSSVPPLWAPLTEGAI